jgi:hypothetical protein
MTPNKSLQVSEARDLIALRNEQLNKQEEGQSCSAQATPGPLAPPKRAPPRCSYYNILGHTRTRCPDH